MASLRLSRPAALAAALLSTWLTACAPVATPGLPVHGKGITERCRNGDPGRPAGLA